MIDQDELQSKLTQLRQLMKNEMAQHERIRDRVLELQELYYDGKIEESGSWEAWACDRFAFDLTWLRHMSRPHPLTVERAQQQRQRERDKQAKSERAFVNRQSAIAWEKQYLPALETAQKAGVNVFCGDEPPEIKKPKKAKKAKRRLDLPSAPPPPAAIAEPHLAACREIERKSRLDLGREYYAMRAQAQAKQLGRDDGGKYWSWVRWSAVYIQRSPRDIQRCIALHEKTMLDRTSCPITQDDDVNSDNIVPLPLASR